MATLKPIDVWFESASLGGGGGTEHRVILENLPPSLPGPRQTIFWRTDALPNIPLPPVMDSYVGPLALVAAKAECDLAVHGPMSRLGLYNLGQLLEARHVLMPQRVRRVSDVVPDRIVDLHRAPTDDDLTVVALSGGLDSTFTVIRHALGLEGEASHKLAAAVMVHGFDCRTEQTEQFAQMRARAQPIADRAGLPLYVVMTDTKERLNGAAWPQSSTPLTACALAMFSEQCPIGMISSGHVYATPRLHTTHPPILDAMSSTGWFRLVTDAGSLGRADKIETLLQFPELLDNLKVCWEGRDPSRNCGVCRKCLLTRLNFFTAGVKSPKCFDGPMDLQLLGRIKWKSPDEARDFFNLCWVELERRGVTGPEVDTLRKYLVRIPPAPNHHDVKDWVSGQMKRLRRGTGRLLRESGLRR